MIQATISGELLCALRQLWLFIHQLAQYPPQLFALATRSRYDRERNRDLKFRIADHMPAVAKPFFDLVAHFDENEQSF